MPDEFNVENYPSVQRIYEELHKTAVLSDSFKDFLWNMMLEAMTDVHSGSPAVEEVPVNEEFASRRFSDVTTVKLGASCMEELIAAIQTDKNVAGLFAYIWKNFPKKAGNPVQFLMLGTTENVIAFRDWFFASINRDTDEFARTVGLGEWKEDT